MHDIFLALMNNLTGVALVITSITGLISVWRNGSKAAKIQQEQAQVKVELMAEQEKQNKHLQVIEGKVDGGMSAMQAAIAHIATAASAAANAAMLGKAVAGAADATTPPVERGTRENDGRRDADRKDKPDAAN